MTLRELLWLILPRRRTTPQEAREAMVSSGICPEEIEWRVGEDGTFAFGRKQQGPPLTPQQLAMLLSWARKRRIKVAFIGWEEARQ